MNDTFLFFSSTMSNNQQRIREIKYHINQLLSELHLIEPNTTFQPFNITINSSLTTISHENYFLEHQCPYLSHQQAILHSTTYHKYKKIHQRKKLLTSSPKKSCFPPSPCITSTPKNSPNQNLLLKPHLTSTPRRHKHQSTNLIPLKRLLYTNKNNKDSNRQRHSTKRSIHHPRFNSFDPIHENPQWI